MSTSEVSALAAAARECGEAADECFLAAKVASAVRGQKQQRRARKHQRSKRRSDGGSDEEDEDDDDDDDDDEDSTGDVDGGRGDEGSSVYHDCAAATGQGEGEQAEDEDDDSDICDMDAQLAAL